jgi:hypothetical protein
MISAPRSELRRRQDNAHMARRWSVDTAAQARGRIKLDDFQRGVTVAADMLHEIPQHASPNDGAAS